MYCFAIPGDMNDGKIDIDPCWQFPVQSFQGMQYICVAYIHKVNDILTRPTKGWKDGHMVEVFQNVYDDLRKPDLTSNRHVMDNEHSRSI